MGIFNKIFNNQRNFLVSGTPQPGKVVYNKLVRNRIPEIISREGKKCNYRIISDAELKKHLHSKINEEAWELMHACTKEQVLDEMADILTILEEFKKVYGIGDNELFKYWSKKNIEKGDFSMHVFLESVEDPE